LALALTQRRKRRGGKISRKAKKKLQKAIEQELFLSSSKLKPKH
jgi:hypothetical protein